MFYCSACKLDFDAERLKKDVTVKCPKCKSSKNVMKNLSRLK